jgi:hypothetical protein
LVVTDGTYNSAPDTVVVFTNLPPVAVAGASQAVFTGDLVTMTGSGSYDPDADPIAAYSWSFVSWPGAAAPALSGATTATPQFIPTAAGNYVLALMVSDFELTSEPATVTVTATVNAPSAPTAVEDYATVVRNATSVFIDLVGNDTDPDGDIDPNSIVIVAGPPPNGFTVTPVTGGVLYTPKRNFRGTDVFTYTVSDMGGRVSNEATVVVNVVRP